MNAGPRLPGQPSCAIPAYDTLHPLTKLFSPNQRGKKERIDPPSVLQTPDAEGRIFGQPIELLTTLTGVDCIVGEEIGVRLARSFVAGADPVSFRTLSPLVVQLRAILTLGLGSAPFQVECDWLHGTSIAVTTDTIGIQARYIAQTDPGGPFPDVVLPAFELAAGIGRLEQARNSNSARLTEIRTVPPGAKLIPIPRQAISVTAVAFGLAPAAPAFTMRLEAFGPAQYSSTSSWITPTTLYEAENKLTIWEGAEFVNIINDGQVPIRVAMVFGLAL